MCLGTAEPQPSCPGCTPVRKLYLEQSILGQGKERSQRRREKKGKTQPRKWSVIPVQQTTVSTGHALGRGTGLWTIVGLAWN